MFVTVETTLCTVLGAFETTFCPVEVTCWTGEGEGDPPLPEPEPVAGEEEPPELEPPLDGAVWFEVGVVDGWLEGVGDGCELERGGALEDGALAAGLEEPGVEVEVLEPGPLVPVVEPVAVGVAPPVLAPRGVAPVPAGPLAVG